MAEEKKEKTYGLDLDGNGVLTDVIRKLVNEFPGWGNGEEAAFSTMEKDGGLAMYPIDDAAIEDEKRSVTGRVRQVCRYTFEVGYKVAGLSAKRKALLKEKLDELGRWLERLKEYPSITDGRKLLSFTRDTNSALYKGNDDKTEYWVVRLIARYENIFYK